MFFFSAKIRTRFAPSPTGYLHVGGLRTALYAYLFARQNRGKFILRLEDTDRTREVAGAAESLLQALKTAGLEADEGLFLDNEGKVAEKGNFGPYTQSQRVAIYQKYAQKLLNSDQAYHCFCSTERLEKLRQDQETAKQPTRYDGFCRRLSMDEVKNKLNSGEKSAIRMKVPENREIKFHDLVRGEVKFHSQELDDQIILKSDGFPTYHLASVVDDHLMKISQVIRGEEWLSSTPKHLLLYKYFGWTPPLFAHLPLLLNPDKTKLSKRQGDVAVEDYLKQGYLPEALVNFVALLGWNPGTEQEIFSLPELVKIFNLKKVHKAGAVFNLEKLDWLNGEYLKKLPVKKFAALARPFLAEKNFSLPEESALEKIMALEQSRVKKLNEVGEGIKFLFEEELFYAPELLVWKKSNQKTAKKNLLWLIDVLKNIKAGEWTKEKLEERLKKAIADAGLNNGEVLWPMRVALTGQEKSPTPFEVAEILGREKSLGRIKLAADKL